MRVRVSIKFSSGKSYKIIIHKHLFRKVGLEFNGKHEGFFPLTKIINRVRKIIVQEFQ